MTLARVFIPLDADVGEERQYRKQEQSADDRDANELVAPLHGAADDRSGTSHDERPRSHGSVRLMVQTPLGSNLRFIMLSNIREQSS
jgi:hypothetical protein